MPKSLDELLDAAQEHFLSGRLSQAADLYRRALTFAPSDSQVHFFLGLVLFQLGQLPQAAESVGRAIELDPAVPEYHCDLGRILFAKNDLPGAIAACRRALELRPEFPQALFNLGNALCRSELFEEGIHAYEQAIKLSGESADAVNNLGMALFNLGRIEEAIACWDRILKSNPADAAAHSNRIFAFHFLPSTTADDLRREAIAWNERHALPLRSAIVPHKNDRRLDRPLRIGYVSADLRGHVVGWDLLPLMENHDGSRFHVYCYSGVTEPDVVTGQLRSRAFAWRDVAPIPDEGVAQMIREDRIDILVDLSLHTGRNRLLVFARKPAPIQISYLGYPGTTGLEAMDYRLSDPFIDAKEEEAEHTERTIRLPRTYWCYRPGGPTPPVGPLPCRSSGIFTFGCLNQVQKVTAPVLDLWVRILQKVPNSNLILHSPRGRHQSEIAGRFERGGIPAQRVRIVERRAWPQYIETYADIDLALDPFPFGGGITTCDALWMGVPVITLRGRTALGRGGYSILHNLGLSQFVAQTPEQYVSIAAELAGDIAQLANLRSTLRQRMMESPLMDASSFARNVEAVYSQVWHEWVNRAGVS